MSSPEPLGAQEQLEQLLAREDLLATRQRELERRYSGLRDLDVWVQLASVRLRIAVLLLERCQRGADSASREDGAPGGGVGGLRERDGTPAREPAQAQGVPARSGGGFPVDVPAGTEPEQVQQKALAAIDALDELRRLNVSQEQRSALTDMPAYQEVTALVERFVALGGGALLDRREQNERARRAVARAFVASLSKFVAPDDRYEQAFRAERLPPLLRRLVAFFLPVLAPENQRQPPYGIEEGHQVLLRSERMKMPLSQAVYYLEFELLPHIRTQLEQDPGNPGLQRRHRLVQERLGEYKGIRWTPRATPINLERGFYTDWLSHYTADGELLVTVEMPVEFLSGTNLDRLQESVRNELVRRLAGQGVCPELDAEYRYRKSLDSGRSGSSRVPSGKLDFSTGFQMLKQEFPVLRRLEDRRQLQQLVDHLRRQGATRTQRLLEEEAPGSRASLPAVEP